MFRLRVSQSGTLAAENANDAYPPSSSEPDRNKGTVVTRILGAGFWT